MTWVELTEIVEWCLPRWSAMTKWEPTEWQALHDDLRNYEATDVRRAYETLWRDGVISPPKGGVVRERLAAMGILPAAPSFVCDHVRETHEPPSRASTAVEQGAGERRCAACGQIRECRCVECRGDNTYKEASE